MKVVFFGTPPFAVPSLRSVANRFSVVGVVTQPDRPAGRGRRPRPSAVKEVAVELGLPFRQLDKIRSPEALAALSAWAPEIVVVAAYGQILPASILSLPAMGCVNVHASLLPRWRGASPVQAALLQGDAETGVTIMRMDEGMDTGPILAQRAIPVRADHSGGSLTSELAELGAQLLIETLPGFAAGALTPTAQDDRLATLAPRIQLADTALDPEATAARLVRQVRAFSPRPGARLRWGEEGLRVLAARALPGPAGPPGTVLALAGEPMMATADGLLALELVQMSGGKPISGRAFIAGHRSIVGDMLHRPL